MTRGRRRENWRKAIKRYKFPVTKINTRDVTDNMRNLANTTHCIIYRNIKRVNP